MRTLEGQRLDPALNGAFFLPYDAEEVIFLSLSYDGASYARLVYRERDWIERFVTPAYNVPGNSPWFYRAENLAWPSLNPGKFTFTTTNAAPFALYIAGHDSGNVPLSESFILQGTSSVSGYLPISITTQNSYAAVTVLSKGVTDSPVTIQAQGSVSPLVMPPGATELVFTQLVLYPAPIFVDFNGSPLSLYIRTQVKLKADTLDNDMSVPRISHIWDALISFTTGALWKRLQQIQKAAADNQDGMDHVKAAINVEKNQSEFRQQVIPVVYEQGDYMEEGWMVSSANPFGV